MPRAPLDRVSFLCGLVDIVGFFSIMLKILNVALGNYDSI